MNNLHFILDYETIGQDVFTAPVVNCAYYVFDWSRFLSDNPYTFNELIHSIRQDKFDVKKQMTEDGCVYKKADLDFWLEHPEAKKQLQPSDRDIPVSEFVRRLYDYLMVEIYNKGEKLGRWWSRSNTFDPILLHRNFNDHWERGKLDFVLPYWLVRDTRTYIDTQFAFQNKKNAFCPIDDEDLWNQHFVAHNSIHDVAAEIMRIQKIERTIHLD